MAGKSACAPGVPHCWRVAVRRPGGPAALAWPSLPRYCPCPEPALRGQVSAHCGQHGIMGDFSAHPAAVMVFLWASWSPASVGPWEEPELGTWESPAAAAHLGHYPAALGKHALYLSYNFSVKVLENAFLSVGIFVFQNNQLLWLHCADWILHTLCAGQTSRVVERWCSGRKEIECAGKQRDGAVSACGEVRSFLILLLADSKKIA